MRNGGPGLAGVAISPGIAHGIAYVLDGASGGAPAPVRRISDAEVESELARFREAIDRTVRELEELQESVAEHIGQAEADIFAAHAMLARSGSLHGRVAALVEGRQLNVEAALGEVILELTQAFDEIREESLRQRRADIRDIGRRILSALLEEQGGPCGGVPPGAILVADELSPSLTANLDLCQVAGVVTERGGRFGHGAILARSSGTPAVSGVHRATVRIRTGDEVIVDAMSGRVIIAPDPALRREYQHLEREMREFQEHLRQLVGQPIVTLDGTPIRLLANVGTVAEAETALLYHVPGVGLCRTEVLFAQRPRFPTEQEQYDMLAQIVRRMHPHPVVLRLLDLGAGKQLDYWPLPAAANPALSRRGIRLLLAHPEVLELQLRVFLRLAAEHDVRILLPGVAGVEEVRETRAAIHRVHRALAAEGVSHDASVPVGAMIELPSAALLTPAIAREVDFLSLGTNDLVQYVLAADRDDEDGSEYYRPFHPAVLSLIASVTEAARAAGTPFGVCGELAADGMATELLVGMGIRELSVAPASLLGVTHAIRTIRLDEAETLARAALSLSSVQDVEALISERGSRLLPRAVAGWRSRHARPRSAMG